MNMGYRSSKKRIIVRRYLMRTCKKWKGCIWLSCGRCKRGFTRNEMAEQEVYYDVTISQYGRLNWNGQILVQDHQPANKSSTTYHCPFLQCKYGRCQFVRHTHYLVYGVGTRSHRGYLRILYWVLNVAVVNEWLQHKAVGITSKIQPIGVPNMHWKNFVYNWGDRKK